MSSDNSNSSKKRKKSYYRKCAYGTKKPRENANILEPGIRGFLVTCNKDEKSAVRECYNILNEYADIKYGPIKQFSDGSQSNTGEPNSKLLVENSDDEDDVEKALQKEVKEMTSVASIEKRFQNVLCKAQNCIFIRTNLDNPSEFVRFFMDDIAHKKLRRARYASRILPIIGTCKATSSAIEKLATEVLPSVFSTPEFSTAQNYTIIFKARNNNLSCCGRESVVSALIKVVKDINSGIEFKWHDFHVAILVEVVQTVCCLGVASDYIKLRKYNLQELAKGPLTDKAPIDRNDQEEIEKQCASNSDEQESGYVSLIGISDKLASDKDSECTLLPQYRLTVSHSGINHSDIVDLKEKTDCLLVPSSSDDSFTNLNIGHEEQKEK